MYGYHSKLLNEYENILPWIKKTIKYQVIAFDKKRASLFVTASVTDFFPTDNTITEYVPNDHPITASVPIANTFTAYVLTYNPLT